MKKRLKLFVWEDVLCDYTSGIMFALAYDVEGARKSILSKMDYDSTTVKNDLTKEPLVITKVEGFMCWGGG